jgi:hypothetical protein
MPAAMKETTLELHRDNLRDVLLPLLVGRAFHVTTKPGYDAIRAAGAIRPNSDATFKSPFGNYKSYFRSRGCVSVFDLRTATPAQVDEGLGKIYFLNPARASNDPVYLFLADECSARLLPWSRWKDDQAWSEMVVPYIEAGHPGDIALTFITDALIVRIDNPPTRLELLYAAGRARAAKGG